MLLRDYIPALRQGAKIGPMDVLSSIGVGNIYYVIDTTLPWADQFEADYQVSYTDGSSSVYRHQSTSSVVTTNGIKNALAACVASRNDYVIVMPSINTYYIDAVLSLAVKGVHLICPAGMNGGYGATNAARIQQLTAATGVATIAGAQAVEMAGFFLKGYTDALMIEIAAGSHNLNLHNNFVGLSVTNTTAGEYGIHATGESQGMFITDNQVTIYSPIGASKTIGGGIVLANPTRGQILRNMVNVGGWGNVMTSGINVGSGAQCLVKGNILIEDAVGTPASSVLTKAITLNASSIAVKNYGVIGTAGNFITGGQADLCAILNYTASAGGGTIRPLDA